MGHLGQGRGDAEARADAIIPPALSTKGTIVSVTPIAIERDSRTLKQAASVAGFGYRSIVVEGEASLSPDPEWAFELLTVPGGPRRPDPEQAVGSAPTSGGVGAGGPTAKAEQEAAPPGVDAASPSPAGTIARARRRLGIWRWNLIGRSRWPRTRWFAQWNRRAHGILPEAQLYMLHSYPLAPAVLRRCLGRRGRRFTYDAHDAYFDLQPGRRSTGAERAWSAIERLTVRTASGFSTVGEGVADLLERRHRRRPVAIRNCHDGRLDQPVERDVREVLGLGEGRFLLVAVGNDKEGTTMPQSIRSLADLPSTVHLACIGHGNRRHLGLAEELGLLGRVHVLDPISPTRIVPFIRGADAALIPYFAITRNYANALPNRFFQAVAAGLPLVYPEDLVEVAALAERHGIGVAVDTRDPSSVAAGIRALLEDEGRARELRRNAERAALEESWEREERVLERLVKEALGVPGAAGDSAEPIEARR